MKPWLKKQERQKGQVENSEITEKAANQRNCIIFHKKINKEINTQNSFDTAWEEKIKKQRFSMIYGFLF